MILRFSEKKKKSHQSILLWTTICIEQSKSIFRCVPVGGFILRVGVRLVGSVFGKQTDVKDFRGQGLSKTSALISFQIITLHLRLFSHLMHEKDICNRNEVSPGSIKVQ